MTQRSLSIVAPRFRHLYPLAPELSFRTRAGFAPTRPASSTLTTFAYTGDAERQLPPLPSTVVYRVADTLWITVNDIPYPNEYKIIGYDEGQPIWGWSHFQYDPLTNILTWVTPPPLNTVVAVYEHPIMGDDYMNLRMPRHVLIQGARGFPTPPPVAGEPTPMLAKFPDRTSKNPVEVLELPIDGPDGQFLGGFRCTLEILSPCQHGQARVSTNRISFEYRPTLGYSGRDSFTYRVVTAFGQASDASCIQLFVGI